ncbi:MAG: preprotein translocase subunit SecE [Candidatus Competibacteraceae bacterium]|jgi:preprotein translocase subunit SecE|nr:preprotein translocase subunit SecE [Candidatus Competibacteraceae bacterium]
MNPKPDTQASKNDLIKLLSAASIVLFALVGFYFFADQLLLVRVIGLLIAVGAASAIALTTEMGSNFWDFVKESRMELRKVVWPTRDETLKTSLAVIVMVIVMGIFLWLLDLLLFWVVRLFTG